MFSLTEKGTVPVGQISPYRKHRRRLDNGHDAIMENTPQTRAKNSRQRRKI
jgi:hypothetical protein